MKKAVAYTRVSTDNQIKDDRYGKESQMEDIKRYCQSNDIEIVRWYHDTISGVKEDRPEFDKILMTEENPPVECVVVAKSDRLARDINIYFYYKMMLKKNDIELVSVAEDFGAFGVFAPMLESFVICVADMERKNITKRTSSGRAVKASKGGYSGGQPPYGYKVMNGQLVIDETQAECVRYAFEMYDNGLTIRGVTDAVNKAGFVNKKGRPFAHSTLQVILNNRKTYEGYYRYGKSGEWVKGQHEAIL